MQEMTMYHESRGVILHFFGYDMIWIMDHHLSYPTRQLPFFIICPFRIQLIFPFLKKNSQLWIVIVMVLEYQYMIISIYDVIDMYKKVF